MAAVLLAAIGCTTTAPPEGADLAPEARTYLGSALDILAERSLLRADTDWPALRGKAFADAAGARTSADTYAAISSALASLGDGHSRLLRPEQMRESYAADNPVSADLATRRLAGGAGYLALPALSGSERTAVAYVEQGRAAVGAVDAAGVCGWVVDLRGNSGGNVWPMLAVAGRIIGDGPAGAFVTPDGGRSEWTVRSGEPRLDGVPMAPGGPAPELAGRGLPVAVLTGPQTASAGEAAAIAFHGRPATRSFGMATRGLPTANVPHPLADGAVIVLTEAREADRTGRVHDGPVLPDEEVAFREQDVRKGDDRPLDAATRWLAGLPSCGQQP